MNKCQGISHKGLRCTRNSQVNKFCWQHQQFGGNMLGEGTAGCVYKPPLECQYNLNSGSHRKDMVMKIVNPCQGFDFDLEDDSDNYVFSEDEISKILLIIDPDNQYFIPLNGDYCTLKQSTSNLQQLQKCNIYNTSTHQRQFRGYFMKDGGLSLEDYIDSHTGRMDIDIFLNWAINIAKALSILHKHYIYHGDIGMNNIVIDHNMAKLIDFGYTKIVPNDHEYILEHKKYENNDISSFYLTFNGLYQQYQFQFEKQSPKITRIILNLFENKVTTAQEIVDILTNI